MDDTHFVIIETKWKTKQARLKEKYKKKLNFNELLWTYSKQRENSSRMPESENKYFK